MMFYSQFPAQRTRQILGDVVGIIVTIVVIAIGAAITATIRTLGQFGVDLEAAGEQFESGLSEAAENLGGVPIIGDGIRVPLDAAAAAGSSVADAGRAQQALVETVAVSAGWAAVLLPLAILALVWLVPRVAFARRASTLQRLIRQGLSPDTLAVRALARAPFAELLAAHPDPAAGWRARDEGAIRALAALELRRAGIRVDALP